MIQHLSQILNRERLVRYFSMLGLALILMIQVWIWGTSAAGATGAYSLPNLTPGEPTWVIDQAGILSRLTRGEIGSKLEDLAKETGNEVRFVTIHRLDYGETIETFTQQLFDKWFPTPEAQANQVILALDNVTNSAAIRAADGLQSVLPEDTANSISQETVMVPLRNGNKYNQAFLDASDRLIAILSGESDPGPPVIEVNVQTEGTFTKAEETDSKSATIVVVALLVAATVIPMATYFLYQAFQS
ncbi:beta-propeller domain-containing protein, methanol dehydrogenase [filamentous cyanobacterium CCP2]|nr:beta-propeller domain-containing protein, methanol dehydrogenase [filamentous cyanobacterium CCP2]